MSYFRDIVAGEISCYLLKAFAYLNDPESAKKDPDLRPVFLLPTPLDIFKFKIDDFRSRKLEKRLKKLRFSDNYISERKKELWDDQARFRYKSLGKYARPK